MDDREKRNALKARVRNSLDGAKIDWIGIGISMKKSEPHAHVVVREADVEKARALLPDCEVVSGVPAIAHTMPFKHVQATSDDDDGPKA